MPNLRKSAGGHLVKIASGHLAKCPCVCVAGGFNFKGCIDRIALIWLTTVPGTIVVPCRHIKLTWTGSGPGYPPGMGDGCPASCPGYPKGGVLIDDVAWMYDEGVGEYPAFLLGGTMSYMPGATVSITKNAGRGAVTWVPSSHAVMIDDDPQSGQDCYDVDVSWTCP